MKYLLDTRNLGERKERKPFFFKSRNVFFVLDSNETDLEIETNHNKYWKESLFYLHDYGSIYVEKLAINTNDHVYPCTRKENAILILELDFVDNNIIVNTFYNLENLNNNNLNGSFKYLIQDIISTIYETHFKKYFMDKVLLSTNSFNSNTNVNFDNLSCTLFNYQKQNVSWMLDIEKTINDGNNVINYTSKEYFWIDENLKFNNYMLKFNNPDDDVDKEKQLIYYGGNLISEAGLGKSIVVLALCLNNPRIDFTNINITFNHKLCNYFYRRGNKKETFCEKTVKDSDYCKEHSTFANKDKKRYYLSREIRYNDFATSKYLIKSKATVIFCPSHLCEQWLNEISNYLPKNLQILSITGKSQLSLMSYKDIIFADFIIVSYNLFLNTDIKKNCQTYLDYNFTSKYVNRVQFFVNNPEFWLNTNPNFLYFDFHRLIFDESHEFSLNELSQTVFNIKYLKTLTSKYRWNITGTPFPMKDMSLSVMLQLTCDFETETCAFYSRKNYYYTDFNKFSTLLSELPILFKRNTKESVSQELQMNNITDTIKLLEFTETEKIMYESYIQGHPDKKYSDYIFKLCCYPYLSEQTKVLLKNCKTFDEIEKTIVSHHKTQKDLFAKELEDTKKTLVILCSDLKRINSTTDSAAHLRMTIGNYKRKIEEVKKKLDSETRTCLYFENVVKTIIEKNECPICLDDIEKDNIAITSCGHKFCWDCLSTSLEIKMRSTTIRNCPQCNNKLGNNDVYLYVEDQEELHLKPVNLENLSELVNHLKSTKLGNLIYYLKHLEPDDKCIIFSQWDSLLHHVGLTLVKNNISLVYCTGTIYQRRNAISDFCKKSTQVIMLSSQNAASGINLTQANKVIFIEPIHGTEKYKNDIENQAVSRADRIGQKRPLEIIRFIIKDTVEEEITNRTADLSKRKNRT